ncbi:MAG TPA: hypothetical protein VFW29_11720, partial [Solirubrobacteraceae bacterium]|nr:hypothetical protein [Solirubrobacteraceae bacterium]
ARGARGNANRGAAPAGGTAPADGAAPARAAGLIGGTAAFASTLACVRALGGAQRLLPYAAYRVLVACAILARARRGGGR